MKPRLTTLRQITSGDDVVQVAIRIGLLALLLYWSFVLIRPFIPILVWGIVLAVAQYPVYTWLSRNLGDRPRLAAVMITLLNLAIVIGPVAWLGVALIGDLNTISDHLGAGNLVLPSPPQGIKDWPLVGQKRLEDGFRVEEHGAQSSSRLRWGREREEKTSVRSQPELNVGIGGCASPI